MANEPIYETQILMNVPPMDDKHVVRLGDMKAAIAGLRWDPVKAVTTSALAGAYDPTTRTITAPAAGAFTTQDDVALALGDRLLVWKQADASQNGIYDVTVVGDGTTSWVLTRSADADDVNEFLPNKIVYVLPGGTTYGGKPFKLVNSGAILLDTTPLTFEVDIEAGKVLEERFTITPDGVLSEWTFTHSLKTTTPTVTIFNAAGGQVMFGVTVLTSSTVKITAGRTLTALDGGPFKVKISGSADPVV